MTQEDRKLLLTDLCARLPYGVMILHEDMGGRKVTTKLAGYDGGIWFDYYIDNLCYHLQLHEFKPYLRPMSSMTKREYAFIQAKTEGIKEPSLDFHIESLLPSGVIVDYLNENHFDYRGLIDKGFALEAPAGMYKNV